VRRFVPFVALVLAAAALAAPQPAAAYPGAPWFEPGKPYDQNFPDPSVVFDAAAGRYYAFATTTGGAYVPAMSSTDAGAWIARDRYPEPACVPGADDPYFNDALPCPAPWAPDIREGRLGKDVWAPGVARIGSGPRPWVMFYAARTRAGSERFCLSVANASDPLGPYTDSSTAPFHCDTDPNGSIDPQPFVDPATGVPYLLWKSEGVPGRAPTRFWVRQLTADGTAWAPGSAPREVLATSQGWEGNVIESPSMVQHAGRWLLFYSANEWDTADYAIGVAFCDGPLGPCHKSPHNPVVRSEGSMLGPGAPSAFVDAGGVLRLAHHYWRAPHVGYPSDPGCDGTDPRTRQPHCASQGQRRMRVAYVSVGSDRVTVSNNAPVVVTARSIDSACPSAMAPRPYADVPPGSTHARAVGCMTSWGVTGGNGPGTYGPSAPVTREQMASFIARLVDATDADLPPASAAPDAFGDDETSGHEGNINRLAAAGIVGGTGRGRYSPQGTVARAQMATFIARAAAFVRGAPLPAGQNAFGDDEGSTHAANIDAVAAAGIAAGTAPGTFSPASGVSRGQMAGFLARLADLLVDDGKARPPVA
jgi:hypothetical protein